MITSETVRRSTPRPWHTDWLILRGISRDLGKLVTQRLSHGDRLLDFGCGLMPYRAMIEATGATYLGADLDETAVVRIDEVGRVGIDDQSVDAVLSIQVLEHVRDLDRYLSEARRILTSDGTLLLSTHGTWLYHPHPEDHRRWTRTGLVHDIEARGFRVDSISAIAGPLATTTVIRMTGFAYVLRRIPLVGRGLAAALVLTMNLRAWIEDRVTPAAMTYDNGCVYMTACTRT